MNACLIAACAAVHHRKHERDNYNMTFDRDNDIFYFRVELRMYMHFNSFNVVIPIQHPDYYNLMSFETKHIEAKTYGKAYEFTVNSDLCTNGIENYVRSKLEEWKELDICKSYREEIINKYLADIKSELRVDLDRSYLDYTEQFCWEVK